MSEQSPTQNTKPTKTEYFSGLAVKYLPEMRLSIRGGKLTKKDNWRNVVEHQLVQTAVAEELADLIGFSDSEKQQLAKASALHDWEKRIEKFPEQFSEDDIENAEKIAQNQNIDQDLMDAGSVEFVTNTLAKGEATELQKLRFYIDNIVGDNDILGLQQRISELRLRQNTLGNKYWDVVFERGSEIEVEIFQRVKEQGHNISSPDQIPGYIRSQIADKIQD